MIKRKLGNNKNNKQNKKTSLHPTNSSAAYTDVVALHSSIFSFPWQEIMHSALPRIALQVFFPSPFSSSIILVNVNFFGLALSERLHCGWFVQLFDLLLLDSLGMNDDLVHPER